MQEIFGLAVCSEDSHSPMYSECETLEQARNNIKNNFTQRLLASDLIVGILKGDRVIEKYNSKGIIEKPKPKLEMQMTTSDLTEKVKT